MMCGICKGSGITTVKQGRETFTLSIPCGACDGTGIQPPRVTLPPDEELIAIKGEIMQEIEEVRHVPADITRRWCERLDAISLFQADAEVLLRRLQEDIEPLENDFPDSSLDLVTTGLSRLSRKCADRAGA